MWSSWSFHTRFGRVLLGLLATLACFGVGARVNAAAYIDDDALLSRLRQRLEQWDAAPDKVTVGQLRAGLSRTNASVKGVRPRSRDRSWPEVYARCRPSVFVLGHLYRCRECQRRHVATATGFVIAAEGVLVTNHHVVDSDKDGVLGAMDLEGNFHPVRAVLAARRFEDVVLLQLDGTGFEPLPVLADAPVGAAVAVIGHPNGAFFSLSTGVISRYSQDETDRNGVPLHHHLVITADFAKGSSGAPVLDAAGNVVGVASATESIYYHDTAGRQENLQQVLKLAVPASCVLDLIRTDASPVPRRTGPTAPGSRDRAGR